MKLVVDTYEGEGPRPVVTHVFHGETRKGVEEIAKAHQQSDRFYKASETTKDFEGIPLRNVKRWEED